MGGIQGINGLPPTPDRPTESRDRNRTERLESAPADGVSLSSEAQRSTDAAQLIQQTGADSEIRQDRVQAAREALERGDYRLENRVSEVAQRLLEFL